VDLRRRERRFFRKLLLVESGVVGEHRAARQRHGFAAKAANRLQPLDRRGNVRSLRALQLLGGRPISDEVGDDRIDLLSDELGIDARLHRGFDTELAHALI